MSDDGNLRRFQSTVPFYVRYRSRYPESLLRDLAAVMRLGAASRVLDLGCGPGFIAVALAPHVAEVVAMDPEPTMLAAAGEAAGEAGVTLTLVQGSSHDLGPHLGQFELVTMGRSFHWMDRDRTLAALDPLVAAGGGVALLADRHAEVAENDWRGAWREVRDNFSGDREAERHHEHQAAHEAALLRSSFCALTRIVVRHRQTVTIDDLIGRSLSMSGTSPARLGERAEAFAEAQRQVLAPFTREGQLTEVLDATVLLARRPGD